MLMPHRQAALYGSADQLGSKKGERDGHVDMTDAASFTDKRCVALEGVERCKVAIQTNNVESDDRGYIYAVDRANTGLHILELTGEARAIAGLPME